MSALSCHARCGQTSCGSGRPSSRSRNLTSGYSSFGRSGPRVMGLKIHSRSGQLGIRLGELGTTLSKAGRRHARRCRSAGPRWSLQPTKQTSTESDSTASPHWVPRAHASCQRIVFKAASAETGASKETAVPRQRPHVAIRGVEAVVAKSGCPPSALAEAQTAARHSVHSLPPSAFLHVIQFLPLHTLVPQTKALGLINLLIGTQSLFVKIQIIKAQSVSVI